MTASSSRWGCRTTGVRNGITTGDSPNDLVNVTMDPNVYIQDKVGTCDIRPGRRPRGRDLTAYVADYRERAGVDPQHPTDGGTD